ncbi:MAG: RsmB/NOP family class I SAM-dependent RNA methyltransferase [Pseudomonadota bacterium]
MAQPTGIHARRAALKMLDAVLRRGETLEQAGPGALRDVRDANDKALARAIAGEALRWLTDLDALIDSATKNPLPDDAKPRSVLRLMLAQALRLETPPHAVIATGLPLLAGGPRRLAHGVFSTLMKREAALPASPTLPDGVVARWGEQRAAAIARGLVQPPEVDLAIKNAEETEIWQAKLGGVSLARGHVRVPRGTAIEKLDGYDEGAWWVQDLAATIPAALMGEPDGHALDLCAAPGGKTMALAARGWKVTALDMSKRRLDALKDNLKRTGLKASPVRADALTWEPKHAFDAVLIDAPCTATGTCRRHPDVLHRIRAQDIPEMVEIQRALTVKAAQWLKPGGTLVYAVCSLESEEGEGQAAWIDETLGLTAAPIAADELPAGLTPTREGWVRTDPGQLPDQGGLDGFFIGRWRKPEG